MPRLTPTSTLFPYTTLFRSGQHHHLQPDLQRLAQWFAVLSQRARSTGGSGLRHHRQRGRLDRSPEFIDRKSTRLNSSHSSISYAVFCLKKKKNYTNIGLSET